MATSEAKGYRLDAATLKKIKEVRDAQVIESSDAAVVRYLIELGHASWLRGNRSIKSK